MQNPEAGRQYEVQEVGIMHPEPVPVPMLYAGQVRPEPRTPNPSTKFLISNL